MMNDDTPKGLGYDPCDRHSFPYQSQDPPFDATSLEFDEGVLEQAPHLVLNEFLVTLTDEVYFDGPNGYRTMDMALRLFWKKAGDSAFYDIAFPDLFAACLDQAMIWEVG